MFSGEDLSENVYGYTFLLNLPMYINFPLLLGLVFMTVFLLGGHPSNLFSSFAMTYFSIDLVTARSSINGFDAFFLVALTSLYIGIMGTVPGHELVHRKRNKFDMFMGNWLMSLSWDCGFAVEHVYGHHKNVGLISDPATAKRGESIYKFIFNATYKEHKDAWLIELDQLRRRKQNPFGMKNRMLVGYFRSGIVTALAFMVGGFSGMLIYLLCASIAKALLEVINYCEHYGLVRQTGESVFPRHSWNSNTVLSSIYLYNVTRHSSHHEKASLEYWELKSYDNAPVLPQGYLTMLFLALLTPNYYHKIMAKKLIEWDEIFATEQERIITKEQNKNSGIPLLANQI